MPGVVRDASRAPRGALDTSAEKPTPTEAARRPGRRQRTRARLPDKAAGAADHHGMQMSCDFVTDLVTCIAGFMCLQFKTPN